MVIGKQVTTSHATSQHHHNHHPPPPPHHNGSNPWGPSSPTEGATAPSPPPSWLPAPTAGKVTVLFNGKLSNMTHTHIIKPLIIAYTVRALE